MKKMETAFQKIIMTEMVFSVVYALFGLIVVLNSDMTNKVVGLLIGTFLLIAGMIHVFSFIEKSKIRLFHYNIVFGVLDILLGILIMFNPLSIINFLNITLGIWLIVESANKIVYFFYLKKAGEPSRRILLSSSVLFLFLGVMILINPFRNIVITQTVGMFIILYNVLNLSDLVLLKKKSKKFLKNFK